MKRLKVKNKSLYIHKTNVSFSIETLIENASFFTDEEVEFLCKMFDYEVVKEKKYAITFAQYFLCKGKDVKMSFCFSDEKNAILFDTQKEATDFLLCLKLVVDDMKYAEVVEV
jgi:hypothetical protein